MIQFNADKVLIRTRGSDNSFIVSFEVGEYERQKIQALFGLEPDQVLKVTVETE